jgi:hypothetical protein
MVQRKYLLISSVLISILLSFGVFVTVSDAKIDNSAKEYSSVVNSPSEDCPPLPSDSPETARNKDIVLQSGETRILTLTLWCMDFERLFPDTHLSSAGNMGDDAMGILSPQAQSTDSEPQPVIEGPIGYAYDITSTVAARVIRAATACNFITDTYGSEDPTIIENSIYQTQMAIWCAVENAHEDGCCDDRDDKYDEFNKLNRDVSRARCINSSACDRVLTEAITTTIPDASVNVLTLDWAEENSVDLRVKNFRAVPDKDKDGDVFRYAAYADLVITNNADVAKSFTFMEGSVFSPTVETKQAEEDVKQRFIAQTGGHLWDSLPFLGRIFLQSGALLLSLGLLLKWYRPKVR